MAACGTRYFNGSLVVPVFDEHGGVTELYGRKITEGLRPGTPDHLYLPAEGRSGARGVWSVAALAAHQEIILTEALIDAMSFWCGRGPATGDISPPMLMERTFPLAEEGGICGIRRQKVTQIGRYMGSGVQEEV